MTMGHNIWHSMIRWSKRRRPQHCGQRQWRPMMANTTGRTCKVRHVRSAWGDVPAWCRMVRRPQCCGEWQWWPTMTNTIRRTCKVRRVRSAWCDVRAGCDLRARAECGFWGKLEQKGLQDMLPMLQRCEQRQVRCCEGRHWRPTMAPTCKVRRVRPSPIEPASTSLEKPGRASLDEPRQAKRLAYRSIQPRTCCIVLPATCGAPESSIVTLLGRLVALRRARS